MPTPSETLRMFVVRAKALKELRRSGQEIQDRNLGRARVDRYYQAVEGLVNDLAETTTTFGEKS